MMQERRDNFRVEAYPANPLFSQEEKDWEDACEEISREIERHVDGLRCLSWEMRTAVVWDTVRFCEFCGNRWTEVSEDYNGGCCDEDEKSNPNYREVTLGTD
jgi:hypothetical protein